MILNLDRLKRFAPRGRPEILAAIAAGAGELEAAGILKPRRLAMFLANTAHETMGFTQLEENLSYSAKRLTEVWPKRFPSLLAAAPYARDPKALAIKVYGGRLGNRPDTEDGWTYRGSGMLQTTGRANFAAAGADSSPDALRTPAGALTSAIKFWTDHGLNALADKGDVTGARKVINGGSIGLAEVKALYSKARLIFT